MLFKHPSLLYGLFFLAIPILVHLFQLRRFSKVDFTNVAFLKPLAIQTRKSRRLKKWLTLIARLLTVACLVLAFCQPFLPGSDAATQEKQTVFYLDNSYSMQAKGASGELYKSAITDFLQNIPPDKEFSLFTNDAVYKNTTRSLITNDLLNSTYSPDALNIEQVLLKYQTLLSEKETINELVVISDFSSLTDQGVEKLNEINASVVRMMPEEQINVAVDTAYITSRTGNNYQITVDLTSSTSINQPITVSLVNKGILQGKTTVTLDNKKGQAQFQLDGTEEFSGQINIEDEGLSYDNQLFINTGNKQKIKVLAVNAVDDDFLQRIYNGDEFSLLSVRENELNYNLIKEQNLIILNEIETLPQPLIQELELAASNGSKILIIPSDRMNNFSSLLPIIKVQRQEIDKKITSIEYNHPLLEGVFNKQVSSFQYPSVKSTLMRHNGNGTILGYQDGSSFLFQNGEFFIFTAALNQENSNFQNSPLIVPIFYNIGVSSLPLPKLYYEVGQENEIAIPISIGGDQVLKLKNESLEVIPRQQAFNNYVSLNTSDNVNEDGLYQVIQGSTVLSGLSFNFSRQESYDDSSLITNYNGELYSSVANLINELKDASSIYELWRYFVMAALFFLLCEILILKFVK